MVLGTSPRLNGLLINPERQRATIEECFVVMRLVGYSMLRLSHFAASALLSREISSR